MHRKVHTAIAAVLQPLLPATGQTAFDYLTKQLTRSQLEAALAKRDLGGLIDALWASVEELREQKASSGAELHSKFMAEASFNLSFGGLDLFFKGLEGLLGAPRTSKDPNGGDGPPSLLNTMCSEHTALPDAHQSFATSNGIDGATSAAEWEFVVQPNCEHPELYVERGGNFRAEHPEWCRRPAPLAKYERRMQRMNAKLEAIGHVPMQIEEVVGGRLYTGAYPHGIQPTGTGT